MKRAPWKTRLQHLEEHNLLRKMRTVHGPTGPQVETEDGPKHLFCSNDYLGLAADSRIARALANGATKYGTGSASSRLVSGNCLVHNNLEGRLAQYVNKPKAVLFPSGYQTNTGTIAALTQEGDRIYSDSLCHASIIDGCRLSRATTHVYQHGNTNHLRRLLEENSSPIGLDMIVTDSVFSMNGDVAPLEEICRLAGENDAAIYVDEAHSLGLYGPKGAGLCKDLGITDNVDVIVGTFGKAMGLSGAFAGCSEDAAALIGSSARGLLYTTGISPALSCALLEALDLVKDADSRRTKLRKNVALFKGAVHRANITVMDSNTPIQPVLIGKTEETMAVSAKLWDEGFFVQGIRPPTVPDGTSRLRITLTSEHRKEPILHLVHLLQTLTTHTGGKQ